MRDVLFCLVRQFVYGALLILVLLVLFLIVYGVGLLFQSSNAAGRVVEVGFSAAVLVAGGLIVLAMVTCGTPLCYAFISALYYRHREDSSKVLDVAS